MNEDQNKTGGTTENSSAQTKSVNFKGKLIWTAIFIVVAALSIYAVTEQSKSFSLSSFINCVKNASVPWLLAAVASMLGFIIFEALAIVCICRAFGYKIGFGRYFCYSAADIYFSAITPSASGGQPACAYFMINDGIPGTVTTAALITNLAMYALSIVIIGAASFAVYPSSITHFGTVPQILICIGIVVQIGLLAFFVLLLKKPAVPKGICAWFIRLLAKIKLVRDPAKKLEKLDALTEEYADYSSRMVGKKAMIFEVLFFNILQRASQIAVTVFTFLATGGDPSYAAEMFSIQSCVVLGTNCIPAPGAIGVTDYFMLDAFDSIMTEQSAVELELLSRSLSFYVCVVICGISVLIKYFSQRKRSAIK